MVTVLRDEAIDAVKDGQEDAAAQTHERVVANQLLDLRAGRPTTPNQLKGGQAEPPNALRAWPHRAADTIQGPSQLM